MRFRGMTPGQEADPFATTTFAPGVRAGSADGSPRFSDGGTGGPVFDAPESVNLDALAELARRLADIPLIRELIESGALDNIPGYEGIGSWDDLLTVTGFGGAAERGFDPLGGASYGGRAGHRNRDPGGLGVGRLGLVSEGYGVSSYPNEVGTQQHPQPSQSHDQQIHGPPGQERFGTEPNSPDGGVDAGTDGGVDAGTDAGSANESGTTDYEEAGVFYYDEELGLPTERIADEIVGGWIEVIWGDPETGESSTYRGPPAEGDAHDYWSSGLGGRGLDRAPDAPPSLGELAALRRLLGYFHPSVFWPTRSAKPRHVRPGRDGESKAAPSIKIGGLADEPVRVGRRVAASRSRFYGDRWGGHGPRPVSAKVQRLLLAALSATGK